MKRSPVCGGTGRNVYQGVYYPVKTWLPERRPWYCEHCGRYAMARLAGQRGRWEYRFVEHPRRGVTRGQWRGYQENGHSERSEVAS